MVDPYAKENYNGLSLLNNDHTHNSNDRNLDGKMTNLIVSPLKIYHFQVCLKLSFKQVRSLPNYIYIVLKKNKGILKVYKLVLYQNTFCPFFYYYYTYIILSLYSNFKATMIVLVLN